MTLDEIISIGLLYPELLFYNNNIETPLVHQYQREVPNNEIQSKFIEFNDAIVSVLRYGDDRENDTTRVIIPSLELEIIYSLFSKGYNVSFGIWGASSFDYYYDEAY